MRSPCHACSKKHQDKNSDECRECALRDEYIRMLDNPNIIENLKMEDVMAARGTCKNCERENMSLPNKGMCGKCNYAIAKAPEGGRTAALAAAKASILSGEHIPRSPRKKTKADKELVDTPLRDIKLPSYILPEDDFDVVVIQFKEERDKKIKSWIDGLGKENRRTADQQILTLLESMESDAHK